MFACFLDFRRILSKHKENTGVIFPLTKSSVVFFHGTAWLLPAVPAIAMVMLHTVRDLTHRWTQNCDLFDVYCDSGGGKQLVGCLLDRAALQERLPVGSFLHCLERCLRFYHFM